MLFSTRKECISSKTLVGAVVARFHDVPWLAGDFINEPSISRPLWTARPNRDSVELQKWDEWLNRHWLIPGAAGKQLEERGRKRLTQGEWVW